jgi:DNA-binding NarL/FixJ family response regulator
LIADDHALVRKGLRDVLREGAEPAVVGEAANGLEALELARAESWDLAILDITMPGLNGVAVLRTLKEEQPQLPVVMLSMHSGEHYVRKSFQSGASAYLSKESAPDELIVAIRTVLAGGRYISRELADTFKLNGDTFS